MTRKPKHAIGKEQSLHQMVLGKLDENEEKWIWILILYHSQELTSNGSKSLKHKIWCYETPRIKPREVPCLGNNSFGYDTKSTNKN